MTQWLLNTAIAVTLQTPFLIVMALHFDVLRRHNFVLGSAYALALCVLISTTKAIHSAELAAIAAFFSACLLLLFSEGVVFRPLERLGRSADELLIASLGVSIVVEQALSATFGDAIRFLPEPSASSGVLHEAMAMSPAVFVLPVGVLATVGLYALLHRTETGVRLIALGESKVLLSAVGVDTRFLAPLALVIVSAVLTIAALAAANVTGGYPAAGFRLVILGFVARLVGGPVHRPKFLLAAIGITVLDQLAAALLPNQWRTMVLFSMLLILIALRARLTKSSD